MKKYLALIKTVSLTVQMKITIIKNLAVQDKILLNKTL